MLTIFVVALDIWSYQWSWDRSQLIRKGSHTVTMRAVPVRGTISGDPNGPIRVNGKSGWGFHFAAPRNELSEIKVRFRGRTRTFDTRKFGQFYNVNLDVPAQARVAGNQLTLIQSCADASVGYDLMIVIRDGMLVSVTPRAAS